MTNEEIQNIFLLECDEGLSAAEDGLTACQIDPTNDEAINSIFRAVHSIKGGAGAFGFNSLQAFTHKFETVLQQVRDGDRALDSGLLKTLFQALDKLSDHVSAIKGDADNPDDRQICAELAAIADGVAHTEASGEVESGMPMSETEQDADVSEDDSEPDFDSLLADLDLDLGDDQAKAPRTWIVTVQPKAEAMANGGEPLRIIRELCSLGGRVVNVDISALPEIDTIEADQSYLVWTIEIDGNVDRATIDEIFDFVVDDYILSINEAAGSPEAELEHQAEVEPETAIIPAADAQRAPVEQEVSTKTVVTPVAATPTIRVDLDKLDRLVDTVGELVITQAMLVQRLESSGVNSGDEMSQLEYLTRELQDCAMSLRAQPISAVFSRVPRIVREVEAQTGKSVRLDVEGENTELDKTVIERIAEPLTHLIRNAVDHGLETPDERIAAGKPQQGVIRLCAEHRGGRILISVSDDGRGINRERVLGKAIERGIIARDAKLTDEEIDNLVFAPGFSTAQTVSNISGRGVGMDVVKQNIQALGGRVTIISRPGFGSTFTLALPLTLAIADGMIVKVGTETLVMPLTHIVECLQPQPGDVKAVGPGRNVLDVRGRFLPIQSVAAALDIAGAQSDPSKAVLIVVETEARGQVVLMVDTICDQRQVVIKSLETNYQAVEGVAGATILGDGRIALIADIEALATCDMMVADLKVAA
ncbi:MAG: chemotaxis protein CheA [Sphingorhabdus sp.]